MEETPRSSRSSLGGTPRDDRFYSPRDDRFFSPRQDARSSRTASSDGQERIDNGLWSTPRQDRPSPRLPQHQQSVSSDEYLSPNATARSLEYQPAYADPYQPPYQHHTTHQNQTGVSQSYHPNPSYPNPAHTTPPA